VIYVFCGGDVVMYLLVCEVVGMMVILGCSWCSDELLLYVFDYLLGGVVFGDD